VTKESGRAETTFNPQGEGTLKRLRRGGTQNIARVGKVLFYYIAYGEQRIVEPLGSFNNTCGLRFPIKNHANGIRVTECKAFTITAYGTGGGRTTEGHRICAPRRIRRGVGGGNPLGNKVKPLSTRFSVYVSRREKTELAIQVE